MTGIYFSGTGNTRHCTAKFIEALSRYAPEDAQTSTQLLSIEESAHAAQALQEEQNLLLLAYPVYYSNLPKIMRDFIVKNKELWRGKKIFVLCTMGLFSGDGAVLPPDYCGNTAQTSSAVSTSSCRTVSVMSNY